MADKVLKDGVEGIARVIIEPGEVNLDFADVRAVMTNAGPAWMGVGQASDSKPGGSLEAVNQALESPLLDVDITGAQRALVNITGGPAMRMYSVQEISSIVQSKMTAQSNIILGTARQANMGNNIRVIVIATGFPTDEEQRVMDTEMIERAIDDPETMKISAVPTASPDATAKARTPLNRFNASAESTISPHRRWNSGLRRNNENHATASPVIRRRGCRLCSPS